ncbi:hypothetical protein GCM10018963_15200 [Saccharothrix longispora]
MAHLAGVLFPIAAHPADDFHEPEQVNTQMEIPERTARYAVAPADSQEEWSVITEDTITASSL